ncbi:DUF58 domain-containing protein [Natrononativus amylolyticus]|uniref:DUF58 domain-containing protein n=1 Tax=Natrononativus amylolyticus TaxID=2963434 RepID=UPI0020CB7AC1|nr:DUF58 domain-containing protein [Natrononativus amylolyticus]
MTATGRWEVGLVVALLASGIGIVAGSAAVFLSSIVGLAYVAYGYTTRPPPAEFAVERLLEPASPLPGDDLEVVVRITNEADEAVADLRFADEPPAALPVVDGDIRGVASLQPGETATLAYTLRARRGEYAFGDVTVVARNVSASDVERQRFEGDDRLEVDDALERLPLAGQTIQHPGRVETDAGGTGTEFYSLREYQPTDPMNRVDWKRLARDGSLTTVEFREVRAASVVVVVDVRRANRVVREAGELDGVALSKHAAGWLVDALLSENNRVGLALYGASGDYLLARSGRDQRARAAKLLEGEWDGSFGRPAWLAAADDHVDRFCRHLEDDKQLVFVTPALDEAPLASARRFRAYGHQVTVVCPTVADVDSPGGPVERIAHERRLRGLREHGVRVLEWAPDESLHVATERANRRWSR